MLANGPELLKTKTLEERKVTILQIIHDGKKERMIGQSVSTTKKLDTLKKFRLFERISRLGSKRNEKI